jgi:hypothetical protein
MEPQTFLVDGAKTFGAATLPTSFAAPCRGFDFQPWISQNRDFLLALARDDGAVLFRGFDVANAHAFAASLHSFHLHNMPYVGGAAVRRNVVGDVVFTAFSKSFNGAPLPLRRNRPSRRPLHPRAAPPQLSVARGD